jgi:uncharacterized protein (TIGR00661 family)
MKILYAIQGTGNGHISRARDIIPVLQANHEVDILVSGQQADVQLPFPVKYKFNGLGFIFGKKGGVDLLKTYRKNNLKRLFLEIRSLPVEEYDLVINDFEPVSAWACYQKARYCIAISHQAAVLNRNVPQSKKVDRVGRSILKKYAPASCLYGFHFKAYDKNIFTPVIRRQVREQATADEGYYTVYLPAYDDKRLLRVLKKCKDTRWQVFSKHNKRKITDGNVSIQPIDNEAFVKSMARSTGVLCGAGFETPAEAMFMKKKLMVIPMKGQYEQQCNAAALKDMGVPVIKSLKLKHLAKIRKWIASGTVVKVDYPDETARIINGIIDSFRSITGKTGLLPFREQYSEKQFRNQVLRKLIAAQ